MPWGHLAVGYLCYVGYAVGRDECDVHGPPLAALAFRTQFPDLVDKPLAWTFGVLPSGRSLAHSLITLTLVMAVVLLVAKRYDRWYVGSAFGIGYFSHLVGDSVHPAVEGRWRLLTNLGWPLLPPPAFGEERGIAAHLSAVLLDVLHGTLGWLFWLQIGLGVAVLVVAGYIELAKRRSGSPAKTAG